MSKYRIVNSNISQVDEQGNLIERGAAGEVPTATEHTAGIIKVGDGLTIENGTLNVNIDTYDDQELRGRIEEVEADTREHTQRLTNKQDTLVSGENIKTINGEPIIGPGNITVTAEGGEPGEPGKPGKDGVGIANIEQPTEDAIRIVKTDGLWHTVTLPRGPRGLQGEPGKDGVGIQGEPGKDGKDGVSIQGEPGKPGADGVGISNIVQPTEDSMRVIKTDGTDHTVTLPRGPRGFQGEPGKDGVGIQGEPGKDGKDGVGISNIEQPTEDTMRVVKTDGTDHTLTLPRGKDGSPGEPGKDGESIQGEPGKPGADGVGISDIEQPTDDTMRIVKTDGTDHTVTLPRGPEGPQGPPGEGGSKIGRNVHLTHFNWPEGITLGSVDHFDWTLYDWPEEGDLIFNPNGSAYEVKQVTDEWFTFSNLWSIPNA